MRSNIVLFSWNIYWFFPYWWLHFSLLWFWLCILKPPILPHATARGINDWQSFIWWREKDSRRYSFFETRNFQNKKVKRFHFYLFVFFFTKVKSFCLLLLLRLKLTDTCKKGSLYWYKKCYNAVSLKLVLIVSIYFI